MDILMAFGEAYREIFQSMSEGIVMVDESGRIAIANPVAEYFFGYGKNEMTGLTIEQLLPDRYRNAHVGMRASFYSMPTPRRMGTGRDLIGLKKNGTEFPLEISLSYIKIQDQIMVMAFVSDISQRKKTEEALKHSEEQLIVYAAELEKKVAQRTEALNQSIQKLEREITERKRAEEEVRKSLEKQRELNELKTKFVSIASHEFRTPLSTVMSSVSLIDQYKEKGELEKIDKHVQRVKSSVDHLTAILNDFLSLGKLEEGKEEVKSELIDVGKFLDEVNEEMSSMLKEGQQIITHFNTEVREIFVDPTILRNILFNLLSNASKYSDKGKMIFLQIESNQSYIQFTVRDEGIGILAEDQKHLFERFFRASNAGNIKGTGLGLNIVKRYVELLNGNIKFFSEFGKGSTFSVSLPI